MSNLSFTFNVLRDESHAGAALARVDSDGSAEASTTLSEALRRMQLLASGDRPRTFPLGNRSSGARADTTAVQIERIDLGWGTLCVKSAAPDAPLATLARIAAEGDWLRLARSVIGESVPEVQGEEPGVLVMEFLAPTRHRNWLDLMLEGDVSPSTAAEVGRLLGRTHAATANNLAIAARFPGNTEALEARLAPALAAAAGAMPGVSGCLENIATTFERTRLALVHGDARPDNVLIGPRGPVLRDAEYACYGDPAFDAASVLASLLAMAAARPFLRARCLTAFDAFCAAYAQRITWEQPEHTDERTARLLPALLIEATHGGQSPWLQDLRTRSLILGMSRRLLVDPAPRLAAAREYWRQSLAG